MLVKLIAKPILNRCLLQPSCYETFVANTVLFGSQTIFLKTPPDL
jgi:hypothetical protein